ncbi:hypothetical protein D0Y65_049045 [Glycine soja]|uniref:Uncharacterized protein n=1 Tax=Glycine soja TaxID=3848 RepID=A0A445FV70_GLYSO|nr:hypothetical protein D0Y65_049045 [Glycine soja]
MGSVRQQYCQQYNILLVLKELWRSNEELFKPRKVSIESRYKGRRELLQMEGLKWRCMIFLLIRTNQNATEILETFMCVMLEHNTTVHASYVEEIKLDGFDLATIMIRDKCFLLELFISQLNEWNSKLLSLLSLDLFLPYFLGQEVTTTYMDRMKSNLILVENQIPLFILCFNYFFP